MFACNCAAPTSMFLLEVNTLYDIAVYFNEFCSIPQ